MGYQEFKNSVLGTVVGDGQCVSLIVNNSNAYAEYLFPGVSWPSIITPIEGARQLLDAANPAYFQAIQNDVNDPNQLPQQGDVLVFDATPKAGYSNQFQNPYGHTGLCESADSNGYTVLHQNSPTEGAPVNLKWYPWNYRPCLGWLRPVVHEDPTPPPAPEPAPVPEPTPTPEPQPEPTPVVEPTPAPEPPAPDPVPQPTPEPVPTPEPAPQPSVVSKVWQQPVVHKSIHTLWQSFVATFLVGVPLVTQALHTAGVGSAEKALIALVTSALAAALSATKTALVEYFK